MAIVLGGGANRAHAQGFVEYGCLASYTPPANAAIKIGGGGRIPPVPPGTPPGGKPPGGERCPQTPDRIEFTTQFSKQWRVRAFFIAAAAAGVACSVAGSNTSAFGIPIICRGPWMKIRNHIKVMQDPPDPNFRTVVQPVFRAPALFPSRPRGRHLAAVVAQQDANDLRMEAYAAAGVAAIQKEEGAIAAGDQGWAVQQANAAYGFFMNAAQAAARDLDLARAEAKAARQDGFHFSASAATVKRVLASVRKHGLPHSLVAALRAAGAGRSEIAAFTRAVAGSRTFRKGLSLPSLLTSSAWKNVALGEYWGDVLWAQTARHLVPQPAGDSPPTAAFSVSSSSGAISDGTNAITFTDTSADDGTITSWQWDFGDPGSGASNSSSAQSPSHTFAQPGTYTVTLTVTDNAGQTNSTTQDVTITATP